MKENTIWLLFFVSSFLLVSCSKKNKVVATPSSSYDKEENMSSNDDGERGDDEAVAKAPKPPKVYRIVTLQKTGCYGNCPDYEFILLSNGEATYIGKKNVEKIGKYRAQASPGFLFDLKNKISEGDLFKMETIYPTNEKIIKDLPDTYLMVSDNVHQIIIRNNHDAPKDLIGFQNKIEEMIKELEWVKK